MLSTSKCILELQDCILEYGCISCEISKQYWLNMIKYTRKNTYIKTENSGACAVD
jgi:hypothetical protein